MQMTDHRKRMERIPDPAGELSPDRCEIFKGLSKSDVDRIFDAGVIRSIDGGKLLFRKGDIGKDMYIVLKGKIHIVDEYDSHKKILAELGPGEFFGEMGTFEDTHRRSATAAVREPSQILVLKEDILNKLIEKKMPKKFLRNIIGVLCHRIRINNTMYMRARYCDKASKDVKWVG